MIKRPKLFATALLVASLGIHLYADLAISSIVTAATGIATWLGTPSSANLASALTDEQGSGLAMFGTDATAWTPVLGGAGGTSGQTYDVQVGRYIKVGKLVVAWGYLDLQAKGTITGDVQIQGFPFTSNTTANLFTGGHVTYVTGLATSFASLMLSMNPNTTSATIYSLAAGGAASVAPLATGNVQDTTIIGFIAIYPSST